MRSQIQEMLCLVLVLSFLALVQQSGAAFQEEQEKEQAEGAATPAESVEAPSPAGKPTDFLRVLTDEFGSPIALQTATAKYVLEDSNGKVQFEVSLEGVIHIADSSYYRGFQSRFGRYDAVLFESILKEDKQAKSSDEEELPSGFKLFQQLSTGTLGLTYQFDEISYDQDNLINADLTLKEISERMTDQVDSQATLFSDLLSHLIKKVSEHKNELAAKSGASQQGTETSNVSSPYSELSLSILTDADGIMKIRRVLSAALVNSGLLESTYPPSIQKVVVEDRNDRVMSVLNAEKGNGKRNVAIFFGVSHMADLEKRLTQEYGMKLKAVNWRNAWDLRDGAVEGAPLEGLIESTFKDSFKSKLQGFAKGLQRRNKTEPKAEPPKVDSEKDKQIQAMQEALKALQSRLEEVEGKSDKQDKKDDKLESGESQESEGGGSETGGSETGGSEGGESGK